MNRRRRVLVSAYACEPCKGSEPGVGWNQVEQIARFADVWVITRQNNARSIEPYTDRAPGVHWVFHDLPGWIRFWKKGQRGVHLYYYLWQIGAYRVGKRLHARIGFDLVHHVTFVNYWMPSFLCLLPVPFIWGPVGGAESAPRGFWSSFSPRGKLFELMRSASRWLGEHDPAVVRCARRARVALATTTESAARLERLGCRKVQLLGESGVREEELKGLECYPLRADSAQRLVSVGRLLHWKGYHLSLLAFARARERFPGCTYWLVGTGPERRKLEALALRLGVRAAVHFTGKLPRPQVLATLSQSDIFVHPSLHDSGGWVCLEAMAAGRPVICMDLGGPATQVSAECGIRVAAITEDQAVEGLSAAMQRLIADGQLRRRMAKAARERTARLFSWNAKGERIRQLYEQIAREA